MGIIERACVALTCDVCHDGWEGVEPHFPTREAADRHARDDGWSLFDGRAVCSACRDVEACALAGHRWGPWLPAGPFPRPAGGSWAGRVRYCRGCTTAGWDPPARAAATLP